MAQLTPLKCPCCDAPLTPPEGRGQFYCQFCGTPVSRPQAPPRSEADDSYVDEPQPAVAIPEKIEVEELGSDLRIAWRWFNWSVLFLIPFCIAWNAFLIGWYSIAFSDNGPPGAFRFIMMVFPLAHVAVGLGLLYACLLMLFNQTIIRISYGNMSIHHGPIPAPGNRTIPVDDIDQLYIKHKRSQGKNGTSHQYPLLARLKSGQEVNLLPRHSELDVSRAVEHLVESHLGIENRRVAGEHRD
ncbi:hypothetical protein Mal4_38230 [Maioricimonas rarisocia]|uniref:Uncharacterized protein n=1 Tax=Maioricimonas rarisocia TaxID=2528026 RepID=A0A517ZAJ0_9PLAN|nr:hypothetical protein [Maioricimonas rarisocia]QDU39478.1 hypothetical protein Mal4_38230 [Maioricimonas rarisocia]